eukprot:NODE_4791_length_1847_cov_1.976163.p1 GENE.NODE_4791_length_1847_cov_1.976163~~NODE_4791_length_1847_cov_1.976163.p1  ORF type:complete len:585 (+),score=144.00 NODE_4791_length_1847_cov_1.976163:71-1825(+)
MDGDGKRTYITSVRSWTVGDVVAGVTIAITSLPQYIAYAELAGLPGHLGVRTSGLPILMFAMVTGSPCLCIGVTSITALMADSTLGGAEYKAAHGEEAWMDILGTFATLVGIASVLLAASGAANLAFEIPSSVKNGWKLGFALTVVGAQAAGAVFGTGGIFLKKNCVPPAGISGGLAAMYRLGWTLGHPHCWDPAATALSTLTLVVVLRCKDVMTRVLRLPGIEVLVATVIGAVLAMSFGYDGDTVGMPPLPPPDASPLPPFAGIVNCWPWDMPWAETAALLGGWPTAILGATAFAGVNFLAIISVEDACKPLGGWSPRRELTGQGVGCAVSGLLGCAPVGGSLSRSMVAGLTGAATPLTGFVSGLATMLLAFPQVTVLLAPTPKAVLAAIVLAAVLPSIVQPREAFALKGADAPVRWVTAAVSCCVDPTKGFAAGLVLHAALLGVERLRGRSSEKRPAFGAVALGRIAAASASCASRTASLASRLSAATGASPGRIFRLRVPLFAACTSPPLSTCSPLRHLRSLGSWPWRAPTVPAGAAARVLSWLLRASPATAAAAAAAAYRRLARSVRVAKVSPACAEPSP